MEPTISSDSRSVSVDPEEWMRRLSLLSQTLKTDVFENDQAFSAISAVEKSVPEMLSWAREGRFSDTKKRVEERVQEAIGSVNAFAKIAGRDPEKRSLVDHALSVATSLLKCDKCIIDQRIEQAVRHRSLQG